MRLNLRFRPLILVYHLWRVMRRSDHDEDRLEAENRLWQVRLPRGRIAALFAIVERTPSAALASHMLSGPAICWPSQSSPFSFQGSGFAGSRNCESVVRLQPAGSCLRQSEPLQATDVTRHAMESLRCVQQVFVLDVYTKPSQDQTRFRREVR